MLQPHQQRLICRPTVRRLAALAPGDVLCLLCDGFSGRMSTDELRRAVPLLLGAAKDDLALAAAALVWQSVALGSGDNHTILLIRSVAQPAAPAVPPAAATADTRSGTREPAHCAADRGASGAVVLEKKMKKPRVELTVETKNKAPESVSHRWLPGILSESEWKAVAPLRTAFADELRQLGVPLPDAVAAMARASSLLDDVGSLVKTGLGALAGDGASAPVMLLLLEHSAQLLVPVTRSLWMADLDEQPTTPVLDEAETAGAAAGSAAIDDVSSDSRKRKCDAL